MKGIVIVIITLITSLRASYVPDQIPDFLILGKDKILLRTFPLEQLNFEIRPFQYGSFPYPRANCLRGYQATWKVIDHKLFLTDLAKIDAPNEKIDVVEYFRANDYDPIVIDGLVFADWYSMNLISFPKGNKKCVYLEKTYKVNPKKPDIRFEEGVMKFNRYRK